MAQSRLNLSRFGFKPAADVANFTGGGSKVGQAYGIARQNSPDIQGLHMVQDKSRSDLNALATQIDGEVHAREKTAQYQLDAHRMTIDAQKEAMQQQSQGQMIKSGIGLVASLGAGLFSDETTKHDIKPLNYALEKLRELRPVSFYYNEEYSSSPERLHHGFIAQEFREVLPDATYLDESTGKLCIDTADVIGILVRAVQELEARVAYFEATKALEGVK